MRPEPHQDRLGRYDEIPDPVTGKKRYWTRATTFAKTWTDKFALEQWSQRQVALGLSQRPDLVLYVAGLAANDPEGSAANKKKVQELCEQAQEYAKAKFGANVGSGLHGITEALDSGRPVGYIPPPYDRDIAAYQKAMAGVEISRNYIETIGLVLELGVAGTMDRLVRFKQSRLPMIGDLKTTPKIGFGWIEISIQLALYAHASYVWDEPTHQHREMLPVDQERALVIHLPAREARCQLYIVDIKTGWEFAQLARTVRECRNHKNLAQPLLREEARP